MGDFQRGWTALSSIYAKAGRMGIGAAGIAGGDADYALIDCVAIARMAGLEAGG